MFLSIPQSIYTTFVVEERFGFNKTTPKTFLIDMLKGAVVGSIIGLPLIYGILWIMQALGTFWWVYAWGFMTVFQLFIIWAYPNFIAPLFNKFSPLEEGETKNKILELLKRTHFESDGLFVMDASTRSSHGNAYFTGFGKTKRIVFFDNLLKTLAPAEVEAVLAHELGHFKKKHIIKGLIKGIVMSFIGFAILGWLKTWVPFYYGHGVEAVTNHTALLLFVMVSGVYTFWITPLMALSSRKFEFEADEFAAKHAQAEDLIHALVKLYKDNASTLTPDPIYSAYYHSHPPALIRVQHLEKL
jgi:STE24 endopeptidase